MLFLNFPCLTLKDNVLSVVSGALSFYTGEAQQIEAPAPFEESSVDLRKELARINATTYPTDYDFNKDVYELIRSLNDGHSLWIPYCFWSAFQNILPAPIVSLEKNGTQNVYIAPDSVELVSALGKNFTDHYDSIGLDWRRYAGAKVLQIEGIDAYAYVDHIASTVSGNYIDHGVRVNSVFSQYQLISGTWAQRFGDLAGPVFPTLRHLKFRLIPVNATHPETVTIPYRAAYLGGTPFTDKKSYWAGNCLATAKTNGVDNLASIRGQSGSAVTTFLEQDGLPRKEPIAKLIDRAAGNAVGLPIKYRPTAKHVAGKDILQGYILPNSTVGVLMVGSFEPANSTQFQIDTMTALAAFKAAGVKSLIVDVTGNGGGSICLGEFLHLALVGSSFGYAGFRSSTRDTPLARKIVAADIAFGIDNRFSFYAPSGFAFLNGTAQPQTYDYMEPPVPETYNGVLQPVSQHDLDICIPYLQVALPKAASFASKDIVIVGNGNCASTCAQFTTVMHERHNVSMVVFGGKPGEPVEYKGMAGNQVLEWADLDTEIKTAQLKNDTLAPPDLLVNANMRVNWRTAYSWIEPKIAIAYRSDPAQYRFPYTEDTVASPQNLWTFV